MQVRRRMELPQDYFSQGMGESPAEGSEREELVDVDDLFPPEVCDLIIQNW